MKKIFVLAIALVASLGIASAQDHVVKIDHKDGSYTQFDVDDVYDITFTLNPWNKVGQGTYTFSDPNMFWEGEVDNVLLRKHYDEEHSYELKGVFGGYGDDVLYFTYNEETGEVYVPDQNLGYEASASTSDGSVYENYLFACDASHLNWMLTDEPEEDYEFQSYYDAESDTFYFAIGYYLWIDAFSIANFGYTGYTNSRGTFTYEKFAVDSEKASPAKKIAKMKNATPLKINNEAEVVSLKEKKN